MEKLLLHSVSLWNSTAIDAMDILEEIIAHKRIENERNRQIMPLRKLATEVDRLMESKGQQAEGGSMRKALIDSTSGIIAEF